MKIYLLNGCPGAGKDTAATIMTENFGGRLKKFATPLKDAATAMFCANNRWIFDAFDTFEEKVKPQDIFFGKTCRQVQIDISEKFLKPLFGQEVFGKILANSIQQDIDNHNEDLFFVSDSGFVPEAEHLVRTFGNNSVVLIRIHWEGKVIRDFAGDSRGYINLDHLGVLSFDVINPEGQTEVFEERLKEIVATTM